jgi:hypothetical protein
MYKKYVLTNYTIQCKDEITKKVGCFLFDLDYYAETGKFRAIGSVFNNLEELYKNTKPDERRPCYVEFQGEV